MDNIFSLALAVWIASAWFTHVVVCIQSAKWILLLVGALVFPIGCVHGTGVWLGAF